MVEKIDWQLVVVSNVRINFILFLLGKHGISRALSFLLLFVFLKF